MLTLAIILNLLISNIDNQLSDPFPEIENFEKEDSTEIFNSENLFDYINGAADLYLKYEFEELYLKRYKGASNKSIKIEIYEHSSQKTAFGIYSNERPQFSNFIDIGYEGYIEEGILIFYIDRYYVKILGYDINDYEKLFYGIGSKVAAKLKTGETEIDFFAYFPKEGRVNNSEKYIHKNFLGYESLEGALTAEYEINGDYFELFMIEMDSENECRRMIDQYLSAVNLSPSVSAADSMEIADPYNGVLIFNIVGRYITGATQFSNNEIVNNYIYKLKAEILNNEN
jgi:hypothetical protein